MCKMWKGAKVRIRVITFKMPWCFWVAKGWKTIETRTHKNFMKLKGETIGIHVGLGWDKNWEEQAGIYLSPGQKEFTRKVLKVGGYIIATAFVEDSRELTSKDSRDALIDCWNTKRYGLILKNIKILPEAIPFRGALSAQHYNLGE